MKIYKQELALTERQSITAGKILSIQSQNNNPYVWYEHGDNDCEHIIYMVGTGHTVPSDIDRYIATVLFHQGSFVFHFYERTVSRNDKCRYNKSHDRRRK